MHLHLHLHLLGMRVYRGRVFKMKEHLDRLFDSARAMGFGHCSGAGDPALVPSRAYVEDAIRATMAANGVCLLPSSLPPFLPSSLSPPLSLACELTLSLPAPF